MAISKQHADACALTAVNASCSATCKSHFIVQVQRPAARHCVAKIRGFASAIQGTDDAVPLRIDAKQCED
jgi:hypothetical protein